MASSPDAEAHKVEGNSHFSAGRYAEAVACYTKAIEAGDANVNPRQVAIYFTNRSSAYFGLKQLSNALEDAIKASQIDSTWAKAFWRQSAAYTALQKPRAALKAILKARSLSGSSVDALLQEDFKSCWSTYIGTHCLV